MVETIFFVINTTTTYNALLERDWIHAYRCIPSSFHKYLIMWHTNGSTKIVTTNAKPFVVTSNTVNAILYMDDMGLMTFYGHDNEGCCTSYKMV